MRYLLLLYLWLTSATCPNTFMVFPLYTYCYSVAVVAGSVTMLSSIALCSDLLVVYVELGVALGLLLHLS